MCEKAWLRERWKESYQKVGDPSLHDNIHEMLAHQREKLKLSSNNYIEQGGIQVQKARWNQIKDWNHGICNSNKRFCVFTGNLNSLMKTETYHRCRGVLITYRLFVEKWALEQDKRRWSIPVKLYATDSYEILDTVFTWNSRSYT